MSLQRRLARAMLPLLAVVVGFDATASLPRANARGIEAPTLNLQAAPGGPEPSGFSLFSGDEISRSLKRRTSDDRFTNIAWHYDGKVAEAVVRDCRPM